MASYVMPDRILSIDVETTCEADLKKVGASKYSKDTSLIVTTAAFAFDNDPVFSIINSGTGTLELPREIVSHLRNGGMFRAWNAGDRP